MNDYPASQISGMRFRRPVVEGMVNIRQLDTNDLLDIEHPETEIGSLMQDVLTSLFDETYRGPRGYSSYEVAVQEGFIGTEEEWLEAIRGKSAYEVAVENGFVGSEIEWLASLIGKSAYQIAVQLGFVGTEAQWLASQRSDEMLPMQCNGVLSVKTYPTACYVKRAGTYRVRASVRTRGTGSSLIVNIHVNGSVSSLSGANRPTITAGSGTGTDAADALVTLAAGDIITAVEVVQVGDDWATLVVQLYEEV